ncbi:hypothetical protein J3A83DRAFT_4203938 [Scleroderma citrinum]
MGAITWFLPTLPSDSPGKDPELVAKFSSGGSTGVSARGVLQDSTPIDRPHDSVLPESTAGSYDLTIQVSVLIYMYRLFLEVVVTFGQWPGYDSRVADTARWCRIDATESLTRQELAREIWGHAIRFYRIVSKIKISPGWKKYTLEDIKLESVYCLHNTLIPSFRIIDQEGLKWHVSVRQIARISLYCANLHCPPQLIWQNCPTIVLNLLYTTVYWLEYKII